MSKVDCTKQNKNHIFQREQGGQFKLNFLENRFQKSLFLTVIIVFLTCGTPNIFFWFKQQQILQKNILQQIFQ